MFANRLTAQFSSFCSTSLPSFQVTYRLVNPIDQHPALHAPAFTHQHRYSWQTTPNRRCLWVHIAVKQPDSSCNERRMNDNSDTKSFIRFFLGGIWCMCSHRLEKIVDSRILHGIELCKFLALSASEQKQRVKTTITTIQNTIQPTVWVLIHLFHW